MLLTEDIKETKMWSKKVLQSGGGGSRNLTVAVSQCSLTSFILFLNKEKTNAPPSAIPPRILTVHCRLWRRCFLRVIGDTAGCSCRCRAASRRRRRGVRVAQPPPLKATSETSCACRNISFWEPAGSSTFTPVTLTHFNNKELGVGANGLKKKKKTLPWKMTAGKW